MSKLFGRVINDSNRDVCDGLAFEHALLLLSPESEYLATMRFWRNLKSVIIGRGQVLSEEVNQEYCLSQSIPVSRRITGGGAVYHDEGNLNISFFFPQKTCGRLRDIIGITSTFTKLLKESLESVELQEISIVNTNSLFYRGKKVSGSAAYFTREHLLYHSTLLLSTDLEKLEKSLIHNDGSKRRGSRYSPTMNLPEFALDLWRENLIRILEKRFKIKFQLGDFTSEEEKLAKKLRDELYRNPHWIIDGKSGDIQQFINFQKGRV